MVQELISLHNDSIKDWLKDVDVLITDSMYTAEEYPGKVGWGHGSYEHVSMAKRAREPSSTHHDPMRTDAQLDVINAAIQAEHGNCGTKLTITRGHGHRPGLTNYARLSSRF